METSNTTSATRSLITAFGVGSGIDMAALATDLAAAQFAGRTDRLSNRSETLDRQISAASNLKSMLLSLSSSLADRIRVGDLSPQPRIANAAVARATLSQSVQPRGSYSLEVTALATAQTLAGPAYAARTDPVGSGTLTLRFGTVTGATFAQDTDRPAVDIAIAAGATLADVASAVNAAGTGVTAYVADTVDGARLVLKGQDGASNGFVLDAAEAPGDPGLAALAWSPAGDPARLLAGAGDAAFRIDGLAMTSGSNRVADAIPGVTLELAGINPGAPTLVTFSDPGDTIADAMKDLTAALNEIAAELNAATDAKSGDLARDSGARALRRSFAQLAGSVILPGAAPGLPSTLADLGLSTQRDGSFALDTERLAATLAQNPQGAAALFTNGLHGIYATIDGIARSASAPGDPGSLGGSISRYTQQLGKVDEDQAKLVEQQEALRARLAARFAISESRVGAAQSTLSFLKNQIAAWNGQGSN